jgi:hypothetical protein
MDRRGFLRRGGALVLASPPLSALVSACTRATSASTTTTSAAPTTPPTSTVSAKLPWDELGASLDGRLIRPGTPGYPVARLAYDPRFDDVRPRAVVMAATSRDVAREILVARDH